MSLAYVGTQRFTSFRFERRIAFLFDHLPMWFGSLWHHAGGVPSETEHSITWRPGGLLRYASEAALETMGAAFEDACKTLREFNNVFLRELKRPCAPLDPASDVGTPDAITALPPMPMFVIAKIIVNVRQIRCKAKGHRSSLPWVRPCCGMRAVHEATEDDARGIEGLEAQVLQKRIGEPLATVQTLMQRDKVIWERGFLATPPVGLREHMSARPSAVQSHSL